MELILENIGKSYGNSSIIKNINFTLKQGETLGIMGESGSGKSTLIRIIAGLSKQTEGELYLDENSYTELFKKDKMLVHKNVQIVFQNALAAVNPNFTVKQVLMEPLNLMFGAGITQEEKKISIKRSLESVKLEGVDLEQKATSLSGGQLQRLCIARALTVKPQILILDEALSGLDPLVQEEMLDMLIELKRSTKLSYIFVAHDEPMCKYISDDILRM